MLYTNGNHLLSREDLQKIPVPERKDVSDRWMGINHGVLADTVVSQTESAGLVIAGEKWYCNPTQTDLFGAVDIRPDSAGVQEEGIGLDVGQEVLLSLGVRHSNLGRYAVSFAVGARVVVCENGMFSGDFILRHRHTKNIDLESLVAEGIKRYLQECETLEETINGMREVEIDDPTAAYLVLESASQKLIEFRYLEEIYRRWSVPPHEEFEPRTAWSLYNAFTETAKRTSPPRQLRLLRGLKPMFDTVIEKGVV